MPSCIQCCTKSPQDNVGACHELTPSIKGFAGVKGIAYHKTRKLQLPPLKQQTVWTSQLQMCPAV